MGLSKGRAAQHPAKGTWGRCWQPQGWSVTLIRSHWGGTVRGPGAELGLGCGWKAGVQAGAFRAVSSLCVVWLLVSRQFFLVFCSPVWGSKCPLRIVLPYRPNTFNLLCALEEKQTNLPASRMLLQTEK